VKCRTEKKYNGYDATALLGDGWKNPTRSSKSDDDDDDDDDSKIMFVVIATIAAHADRLLPIGVCSEVDVDVNEKGVVADDESIRRRSTSSSSTSTSSS